LLESFIQGQQVSVDGIISGDTISCFGVIEIERIKDPRYFLEAESWMPTRLGTDKEEEIEVVAARATRALGLRRGGFHCELKVSAEGITVIEVAARRGADNVSDFVLKTTGVDVYAEAARLACGEHREHASAAPNCAMGMRYFLPPSSGRIDRVNGLEAIRRDPRVSELVIEFESGAMVEAPPDGYEFLGYLSVTGIDRDDATRVLDELCAQVEFHIVPEVAAAMEKVV
jgi:biotin carboxylase